LLDECLHNVRVFIEEKQQSKIAAKRFSCSDDNVPGDYAWLEDAGSESRNDLVLKEETYVELGSPRGGGCSFVVWTKDPLQVNDGCVTLVGADMMESEGECLPFCLVLLVGGRDLSEKDHQVLQQSPQRTVKVVKGCMARSVPGRTWLRVSRDAIQDGLCFEALGRTLVKGVKALVPQSDAIEVLFITSNMEDVGKMESIAADVEDLNRWAHKQKHTRSDGSECDSLDCDSCDEQDVCDIVRDAISHRAG